MKYANEPGSLFWIGTCWKATSISEFWRRWNPVVSDENANVLKWIHQRTANRFVITTSIFTIFLFWGLIHDGFIFLTNNLLHTNRSFEFSFTYFFCLNAVAVILDKNLSFSLPLPNRLKTILVFLWLLGSLRYRHLIVYYLFF
ncbi:MAG: hypothetical protein NTX72_02625 [Candidatus Uhrbacteria bacterium]|nr:hypothetical protein [Candidatus Uhrbacteria bacterium]